MGSNYDRLFVVLTPEQPPAHLCEQICGAARRERIRHERVRLAVSSLSGMSSLVGLMLALPALLRAADATGFTSYAPLMVSDSDVFVSHLSTFGLTLLEALPGFEVTLTLFLLAVLLVSLKNIVRGAAGAQVSFGGARKATTH